MKGFEPSFLEKLFDEDPRAPASGVLKRLSIEQVKESVARDLESLLNSRMVLSEDALGNYPECRKSVITYGLNDFSGLSLASSFDRAYICRSLEQAILQHEPRLKNVRATLDLNKRSSNSLHFSISAVLELHPAREPVNFDALLQPTTLQYSVSRARRTGV